MICLGNVTVGPRRAVLDEALAALPGTKVLVAGNHDFGAAARGRTSRAIRRAHLAAWRAKTTC